MELVIMSLRDQLIEGLEPCYLENEQARYSKNGKGIPSVTEILGFIDCQGLIDWANMVGRKGINNKHVLKRAAQYGTNTHSAIENFLKGKDTFTDNSSFMSFKLWWYNLHQNTHSVEIIGQEEPLVGEFFAGTYDLLLNIDGKIYLIDFKTSNHVSYKYFMQLAAYRYLLYTLKNINIHGCIILQLGKNKKPKFNEFALCFEYPEHHAFIENCTNAFFGLLYTYHTVENAKIQFDNLFY